MKRVVWAVTLSAAALLIPAQAFAQKVNVDFDPVAPFANYKTYGWAKGTPSPNPLGEDRIHAAVEERMAAKGFTKVDANPDVFVVYHVAFDKEKDISTYSSGYGGGYGAYGWGWGGGMGTTSTQVRDILVGTLVIDIADAKQGQLAWRGMGVKEINTTAKPDKRDKSIKAAVDKIFKNYPPKVK